jgi:hypothetical protein
MTQWLQLSSDDVETSGSVLDSVHENIQFLDDYYVYYIYQYKSYAAFSYAKKKLTISSYNYIAMKTI